MALQPCPECGHQVSDRAAVCPGCGAPVGASGVVVAQPPVEEWALSQLKAGTARRPLVERIVSERGVPRSDADALVKRLEAALVPGRPAYLVRSAAAIGIAAVLLLALLLLRMLLV